MKTINVWFGTLMLSSSLLISTSGFGQYGGQYPGGGGMRGGGMGNQSMGTPSRPQIPNIAGDMANKETKWLKENLLLDKEQTKAVKKLNNEYADQQQDAIKDIIGTSTERPTPDAIKQVQSVMLMLNEEKEDKLRPLLTPDQWTQYQAKKEAMQKEIGGFRPPAPKGTLTKSDSTGSAKQQP